jgi:hypothetical protein
MDNKGYVMGGMSFLLVLPAILLCMVFIDLTLAGENLTALHLESGITLNLAEDMEANIPLVGREVIKDTADEVAETGEPLVDSRKTVKNKIQVKMDEISLKVRNKTGLNVECNITSVATAADPFQVEVNSSILVKKDSVAHQENISQKISLTDPQCPVKDPLPFIKCKNYGGVQINGSRIFYGSSLTQYLMARGMENAMSYENATAPLIIKKCPYDPYVWHGKDPGFIILKNCIDNGYFHESSDGSCFLCRLEGKGTCPHYGMETFISPGRSSNSPGNGTVLSGPCSSDHVIFNDTTWFGGTYAGRELVFYFDGSNYFKLFLDNGHRQKYGLPMF